MSIGRLRALVAASAVALGCAAAAQAHQTAVNNGVAVTVHVNPNDEPLAAEPTTILVPKVKVLNGTFAWATCRCTIHVFDSKKTTVLDRTLTPRTEITFPDVGAYQIDVAGRVLRTNPKTKRKGWATFKVTFAIRAY